jgi:hypothetical protein
MTSVAPDALEMDALRGRGMSLILAAGTLQIGRVACSSSGGQAPASPRGVSDLIPGDFMSSVVDEVALKQMFLLMSSVFSC